jgi:hypothetical protein
MIRKTCDLPFFGGMYNSIWSENKINPIFHYSALQKSHGGGNLGNNIF